MVHEERGPRMTSLFACHGTDDGQLIGNLGSLLKMLSNLNARHIGRYGLRFASVVVFGKWTECFELTRPTFHPE